MGKKLRDSFFASAVKAVQRDANADQGFTTKKLGVLQMRKSKRETILLNNFSLSK